MIKHETEKSVVDCEKKPHTTDKYNSLLIN